MSFLEFLPDLIRSFVTTIMLTLLLFTLSQPKFGKKIMALPMIFIVAADFSVNVFFYLRHDYTSLAKFDIIFFAVMWIAIKPFFHDTIMQWLFNCLTILNIYGIVVVLTFLLCLPFPYSEYVNIFLRLVFFAALILILSRWLRPLYRKVVGRWHIFLIVSAGVFINFAWYFLISSDIEATISTQFVPLILLILLTVLIYISVFNSLKSLIREYELLEENLNIRSEQEIWRVSITAMEQRIKLTDKASKRARIAAHDHRHFSNTLLGLLRQDKSGEAISLLEKQLGVTYAPARCYCENTTVNAAISYCAGLGEQAGVAIDMKLDIPAEPGVDSLDLAMVISNLLENAIHACEPLPEETRIIRFKALFTGRLLLEMENLYAGKVELDEDGYPVSGKEGHGIGTKSVIAFMHRHKAQLFYDVSNQIFQVRLMV